MKGHLKLRLQSLKIIIFIGTLYIVYCILYIGRRSVTLSKFTRVYFINEYSTYMQLSIQFTRIRHKYFLINSDLSVQLFLTFLNFMKFIIFPYPPPPPFRYQTVTLKHTVYIWLQCPVLLFIFRNHPTFYKERPPVWKHLF